MPAPHLDTLGPLNLYPKPLRHEIRALARECSDLLLDHGLHHDPHARQRAAHHLIAHARMRRLTHAVYTESYSRHRGPHPNEDELHTQYLEPAIHDAQNATQTFTDYLKTNAHPPSSTPNKYTPAFQDFLQYLKTNAQPHLNTAAQLPHPLQLTLLTPRNASLRTGSPELFHVEQSITSSCHGQAVPGLSVSSTPPDPELFHVEQSPRNASLRTGSPDAFHVEQSSPNPQITPPPTASDPSRASDQSNQSDPTDPSDPHLFHVEQSPRNASLRTGSPQLFHVEQFPPNPPEDHPAYRRLTRSLARSKPTLQELLDLYHAPDPAKHHAAYEYLWTWLPLTDLTLLQRQIRKLTPPTPEHAAQRAHQLRHLAHRLTRESRPPVLTSLHLHLESLTNFLLAALNTPHPLNPRDFYPTQTMFPIEHSDKIVYTINHKFDTPRNASLRTGSP